VMRTHLAIWYRSDQSAASEFTQAAFGMQVVTDSASGAGIASVPTPITDSDSDFFVYQPLHQEILFKDATGFGLEQGAGSAWIVDSKAMRKVGINDDIAMTLEVRSAVGSAIAIEGRMLVKLH